MAATKAGAALTEAHRLQQLALRAAVVRDVARLWPMWKPSDPSSYQAFETAMALLVQSRSQHSWALAARYYEMFAGLEAPAAAKKFVVQQAAAVAAQQIAAAVSATSRAAVYSALGAGQTYAQAMANGLVQVSGAASRLVLNTGRDTIIDAVKKDRRALGWARVTDSAPCAFCAMLASRGPVYSEAGADFQSHGHCVPGDTMVRGPSAELGYRRWYEGEAVVIGTADGCELTITPNHPVLTGRGWVASGLVEVGDEIAQRSGSERYPLLAPDEQDAPTPIEDEWRALSVHGLVAMPVAAEDFHGDGLGGKGEVDVVASHSLLADERDAALRQSSGQVGFAPAGPAAAVGTLASGGDAALVSFAVPLPSPGPVSSGCVRGSVGIAEMGGVDGHRFGAAAHTCTCLAEPAIDDSARDVVAGREFLDGDAGYVISDEGSWSWPEHSGRPVGTRPRFDPPADEGDPKILRVHADLGRDLLERLARGVQLTRVLHLHRVQIAGHVFNLQTTEGWYEANGIIVSNCGCTAEPVFSSAYQWPGKGREYQALWKQTGSLNTFRKALNKKPAAAAMAAAVT